MKDIDHARDLLKLARADLKALAGMRDPETFTDAIFGFHAQQAIEKGLKAWLATLGAAYPKTHDLRLLLTLLEERNQDVEGLWDLLEFNPYAVQLRYDWTPEEAPLDRQGVVEQVTALLVKVADKIEGGPDDPHRRRLSRHG
ncbi:MAG: HEPN domain-containing protein [Magnetococcales bacterium]|nr:HEPN domain-containing protein [Magnetococcales bacterium]